MFLSFNILSALSIILIDSLFGFVWIYITNPFSSLYLLLVNYETLLEIEDEKLIEFIDNLSLSLLTTSLLISE